MSLDIIAEVWDALREHVDLNERGDAADTLVNFLIDNNYDNMAKYIYFIDMKYLIIPEKSNKIDIFDKYKSIIIRGSNASGMMKYTY